MHIINIIPAPVPKKAVYYNLQKDKLFTENADIIALTEIQNPDNPQEAAVLPLYMCCDALGVYFPPQMDITFLEFIGVNDEINPVKYEKHIVELKKLYANLKDKTEVIEVESKGNIRKIIRPTKIKDEPKTDS